MAALCEGYLSPLIITFALPTFALPMAIAMIGGLFMSTRASRRC